MRRSRLLAAGALLALCLASACNTRPGCLPDFPDPADVVSVAVVTREDVPPGRWPRDALKRAEDIRAALRWLQGIDWSAKPGDLRVIDIDRPAELVLTKKDGSKVMFGLTDGGIIVDACNGLWSADTDRLKSLWP